MAAFPTAPQGIEDLAQAIEAAVAMRARAWAVRPVDTALVAAETRALEQAWATLRQARHRRADGVPEPSPAGAWPPLRFASAEDAVKAFVDERCALRFEAWVSVAETRQAYAVWAKTARAPELSARALTAQLRALGVRSGRTARAYLYLGLAVRDERSERDLRVAGMNENEGRDRAAAA